MFGFIRKKDLHKYISEIKDRNRKENLGSNYEDPISEKQQIRNIYNQGYEDGTDNMFNAICAHFDIKTDTLLINKQYIGG
jgi:hypothetical protein